MGGASGWGVNSRHPRDGNGSGPQLELNRVETRIGLDVLDSSAEDGHSNRVSHNRRKHRQRGNKLIKCMTANAQSLNNKMDELALLIA